MNSATAVIYDFFLQYESWTSNLHFYLAEEYADQYLIIVIWRIKEFKILLNILQAFHVGLHTAVCSMCLSQVNKSAPWEEYVNASEHISVCMFESE